MDIKEILDIDKNEQVIIEVRRHYFGLLALHLIAGTAIVTLFILLYWSVSNASSMPIDLGAAGYGLLFGFLIMLVGVVELVGDKVYKSNLLVITNENIIQVLQFSLLNRQTSQLNLAKIQDVSVDQVGIIPTMLGYGTIDIETAGEAANFRFPYAPNPDRVAKIIIEAHEDYIRQHPAGHNTYRI
jgi:uncharacterized membrane protein YdbT with pleckstrin-like domain